MNEWAAQRKWLGKVEGGRINKEQKTKDTFS